MSDMQELNNEIITDTIAIDDGGTEIENVNGDENITTPFDPTLIRVDTRPMTINLLLSRILHEELDLQPGFQRNAGIWSESTQSRLIESILIRIPLPAFYMDATDEDKWLVVDGLQRLTSLRRFIISKELKLRGLQFLTNLDGKTYDELPRNLQRRIEETQVIVYLIEKGSPNEVKFNIFRRINTEGLPLSGQEIRHALYQGKATDLLAQLANSNEFMKAIDYGINDNRMAARESILRFLTFTITPYTSYDKDLDSFLNKGMADINKMSTQEIENLQRRFIRTMMAAYEIFGREAFRKRYKATAPRSPINKALFETWSVNLSQLSNEQINVLQERKALLQGKFVILMNDTVFNNAVSQATGDASKVKFRFRAIEQLIKEVLS
ncbi:MAG: DUF262 domain-containing protein [Ktedonobacteraceae bacterium]